MKSVVLLEFADDAAEAARLARDDDARVVAVTPEAMQTLDDLGVQYDLAIDGQQQEREDQLAYENLGRLGDIAAAVDQAIRAAWGSAVPEGFSLARCWGQQIIILLNALAFRLDRLRAICAAGDVERVVYFRPPDTHPEALIWLQGESVWAAACEAEATGPAPVDWQARSSSSSSRRVRRRIITARIGGTRALAAAAARAALRRAAAAVHDVAAVRRRVANDRASGERLLLHGSGQEIERAADALSDWNIVRWRTPPSPASVALAADAVECAAEDSLSRAAVSGSLRWQGVDARPAIERRWRAWIATQGPRTLGTFVAAAAELRRLAPSLILHGEIGPDAPRRTVLEAAGALGIPRVLYQWGGNYGYMRQPYLAFAEFRSDVFLSYTAAVAGALPSAATVGAEPVPAARAVGSLYFADAARSASEDSGAAVVYLPSALTGPFRYGPHLCADDVLLYRLERRIIAALASRFPGRVIVKLHPANRLAVDPTRKWAARAKLQVQVTSKPLEQLIARGRVWIIDGLATTFQQVTQTGRGIIYIDTGGVEPTPAAAPLINAAVERIDAWCTNLDARLVSAVERALAAPENTAARQFFREYVGENQAADVRAKLHLSLSHIAVNGRIPGKGQRLTRPM